MSPDDDMDDDIAADMEMTTKEAAAYLSGPVGYPLHPQILYGLKATGRGPVVEKRGRRLVYRRSALDAFLRENGTDPNVWIEGLWREVAGQLRAITAANPGSDLDFTELAETLDSMDSQDKDDWDPDAAK